MGTHACALGYGKLVLFDLFELRKTDKSQIPWIPIKAPLKSALNQSVYPGARGLKRTTVFGNCHSLLKDAQVSRGQGMRPCGTIAEAT